MEILEVMRKILIIMFVLVCISLVSAVPPLTTEFVGDIGLDIQANVYNYYKINEGAAVQIHVFNKSNGELLSSPAISCSVELTDHNGTIVLSGHTLADGDHFNMTRPPAVVDTSETYALIILCNNSEVAGFKTAFFDATPTGRPPLTEGERTTYVGSLFIMSLFSVFFFMLSLQFKPNIEAQKNEDGSYQPIPNDKPALRFGCLVLSFIILFIILLYVMVSLQTILYSFTELIDSYYIFMWLMGFLMLLMFIFILITLLIQAVDSVRSKKGLAGV